MFTYKIVEAVKDTLRLDQSRFLDVKIHVLDAEGEYVETRKFGFDLETPEEEIREALDKAMLAYNHDKELAAASEKVEEAEKVADETASALVGKEQK